MPQNIRPAGPRFRRPAGFASVVSLLFAVAPYAAPVWAQERKAETPTAEKPSEAAEKLIVIRRGDVPVILSAPHGGRKPVPGAAERKGEGARKFVTVRDDNTAELAEALAERVEKALGGKPYIVIAHFERKYADVNRSADDGVESDAARPVYERYHKALREACDDVRKRWGTGLLLDLHGQGGEPDALLRGTDNGKSVLGMLERHGPAALVGPKSVFGALSAKGYRTLPVPESGKPGPAGTIGTETKLSGAYIVHTYGSSRDDGLDVIQMEFGGKLRAKGTLEKTASDVADAIKTYAAEYLPKKEKDEKTGAKPGK